MNDVKSKSFVMWPCLKNNKTTVYIPDIKFKECLWIVKNYVRDEFLPIIEVISNNIDSRVKDSGFVVNKSGTCVKITKCRTCKFGLLAAIGICKQDLIYQKFKND